MSHAKAAARSLMNKWLSDEALIKREDFRAEPLTVFSLLMVASGRENDDYDTQLDALIRMEDLARKNGQSPASYEEAVLHINGKYLALVAQIGARRMRILDRASFDDETFANELAVAAYEGLMTRLMAKQ